MIKLFVLAGVAVATAASVGAGGMGDAMKLPAPAIAPARDGNIAIAQELEAARSAASPAAYELFIARHPGHPLVQVAERELAELAARPKR